MANKKQDARGEGIRPDKKITRRELLKTGGKLAVVTAASSALSPWLFQARAAGPETLTFWQFYAPGGPVATQSKWFADMANAWNAEHEPKVELKYIADYINGSKLQTSFAAGQGPDIFLISAGDFLRYYNGGVLMDLTPYMEKEARQDFFDNTMATRLVDGKVYGLPMEVEPMAMYYSVKAFKEAGLTETDIPTTWEQLLDVAERLNTQDRFGVLFETTPGYYQNFTWYPFMWEGGGDMVAPSGKKSLFDSKGAVQALQFWQDSIKRGVAPRKVLGVGGNDVVANLGAGYCAMQNVGIWAVSALRENAPDFEYGVFKPPLPPGGKYTTDLGGWAFVANSRGKNPEMAAKFCVWALGSMSDDSIQRMVDWCIHAKSDITPRKSALKRATAQGGYNSPALMKFKDEIFPGGRAEPRVPPDVYKAVSDAIQACQLSGADPQQQAQQSAQRIEAFLAGYSGAAIR
jgi:multiple sugar transport system substrate-binding protein